MTTQPQDIDPFAGGDSAPSLSFRDKPVGTTYTGTVTEAAKLVQSRDFETGEPASWPDGNPKMAAVVNIVIDGEPFSVWASKPSAMFTALATAQREAGARIEPGGTLAIRYTGDKPNANPRLNAQKLYAAKYTAPAPPDVFAAPATTVAPVQTQVDDAPPW